MHRAAWNGDYREVFSLLVDGVDPNVTNELGWTPLNYAIFQEHDEVIRLLVDKAQASFSIPTPDGWLPLHAAAYKGNLMAVVSIIEEGCPVGLVDCAGLTALHKATENNNVQVVSHLLEMRSNPRTMAHNGFNALHTAAASGHQAMVQMFLAKDRIIVDQPTPQGFTPLHCAATRGHHFVAQLLLKAKADLNAMIDGATPLHMASEHGNVQVMETLLEANADCEAREAQQLTPLMVSVMTGHVDALDLLVAHKANLHAQTPSGHTLWQYAMFLGQIKILGHMLAMEYFRPNVIDAEGCNLFFQTSLNVDIATSLLACRVDPNFVNPQGLTPLMHVCEYSVDEPTALDAIRALTSVKANPHCHGPNGVTALHIASCRQWVDVCRFLLDLGVDRQSVVVGGYTAAHFATNPMCQQLLVDMNVGLLMQAVRGLNDQILPILVELGGAIVNSRDACYRTPLMEAVLYGNERAVVLLLDAGADADSLNHANHTALMMAHWLEYKGIQEAIEARGHKLSIEEYTALTHYRQAMKRMSSTRNILTLPIGCQHPELINHQPDYLRSKANALARGSAALPMHLDHSIALDCITSLLPFNYRPEMTVTQFLHDVRHIIHNPPLDVLLWDLKCLTIGQVAQGCPMSNAWHIFTLFLYTYPSLVGEYLTSALQCWDEVELHNWRPIVHELYEAVQALPAIPKQKVYRALPSAPSPSSYPLGAIFTWLGFTSVFRDINQARALAPHGCIFEITTNHAKDISCFGLQPLCQELLLPMASSFRVQGFFMNGRVLECIPDVEQVCLYPGDYMIIQLEEAHPPYERPAVQLQDPIGIMKEITSLGVDIETMHNPFEHRLTDPEALSIPTICSRSIASLYGPENLGGGGSYTYVPFPRNR